MDDRKMEIIQQIMEQLQDEMSPGKEDFASRLGKTMDKDPKIEVMKLQSGDSDDPDAMGDDSDMMGMGCDDDSMAPDSPEEKLKQRLMKMRG